MKWPLIPGGIEELVDMSVARLCDSLGYPSGHPAIRFEQTKSLSTISRGSWAYYGDNVDRNRSFGSVPG